MKCSLQSIKSEKQDFIWLCAVFYVVHVINDTLCIIVLTSFSVVMSLVLMVVGRVTGKGFLFRASAMEITRHVGPVVDHELRGQRCRALDRVSYRYAICLTNGVNVFFLNYRVNSSFREDLIIVLPQGNIVFQRVVCLPSVLGISERAILYRCSSFRGQDKVYGSIYRPRVVRLIGNYLCSVGLRSGKRVC